MALQELSWQTLLKCLSQGQDTPSRSGHWDTPSIGPVFVLTGVHPIQYVELASGLLAREGILIGCSTTVQLVNQCTRDKKKKKWWKSDESKQKTKSRRHTDGCSYSVAFLVALRMRHFTLHYVVSNKIVWNGMQTLFGLRFVCVYVCIPAGPWHNPPFKERIPNAPHTLKTEKCLGEGWAGGGSGEGTVGQTRGVEEGLEE